MTLKLAPNDVFAKNKQKNIDFEPQNDEEKMEFSRKINEDLMYL